MNVAYETAGALALGFVIAVLVATAIVWGPCVLLADALSPEAGDG